MLVPSNLHRVAADLGSSKLTRLRANLATNLGNDAQLLDTAGGGYVAVEYLFIQFAGFTFGQVFLGLFDAMEWFSGQPQFVFARRQ
jgi:hypothetical protein